MQGRDRRRAVTPPSRDERSATLCTAQSAKMARSAHAFVRGNTAGFYEQLAALPRSKRPPTGPAVWICGDCHLGNLGPLSDGEGRVEIQIRDLDQTVIGNPAHDLIRLALSLASAARGSDLPGLVTARMLDAMIEGYAQALADPVDGDPGPEPDVVRTVKRRSLGRRWKHLARERIGDADPQIPLGKKFWKLEGDEREALVALFDDPALRHLILSIGKRDSDNRIRLVDAAYWMKGCSSLGLLRYAAVFAVKGAEDRDEFGLVDIKQATAPLAPVARGGVMPQDDAERVVAGAKALSPFLGERMAAGHMLGRPVFVRELAPQDLKLEVGQFSSGGQAVKAARYLAFVVGRAHARQMTARVRKAWRAKLLAGDPGAPPWLWNSVAALAAEHEAGYLEHCRRHAASL